MNTLFILSLLFQLDLIGLNVPILGHLDTSFDICYLSISLGLLKINQKLINWSNYSSKLNGVIISNNLISESINSFWHKHVDTLPDNHHVVCLFRVKSNDGIFTTIGELIKLTKYDKEYYINHILRVLTIKNDEYKTPILSEVVISFGQRKGKIETKIDNNFNQEAILYQKYKKHNLPVTMDPLKYGRLFYFDDIKNIYIVNINDRSVATINVADGFNKVEISRNGYIVLKYTDQIFDNKNILRKIGNNTYHYSLEGELKLTKVLKPVSFIKPQKKSVHFNNKFITLDLETIVINNQQVPYLACTFDGEVGKTFHLSDYKSVSDMLKNTILSLCKFKYNRHIIYVHNLANFDGIFLLKHIANIKDCTINLLYNNDKIISIDLKYQKQEWKNSVEISFRDSYQILPAKLSLLAKCFNIYIGKGIFPFKFINELASKLSLNKALQWEGNIPSFNYFENVTKEEYNNYCKSIKKEFNADKWIFRLQSMTYCLNDCIVLYKVLLSFNKFYFDLFKININQAPTLASHAMRLFRTQFFKKDIIQMVFGKEHDILRTAYTGGSTDMYIPTNDIGEKVYGYDVNSLYPFVMANFPMPVGQMIYFDGDISLFEDKPFGFFYCEIDAPKDIKHPILQLHIKFKNKSTRTIAATGKFEGLFFSEELYNAQKYGYKFKILWGYTFEKEIIFNKYVEYLYKLRLEYSKDHPLHFCAKLFLNSLYGKFGMKDVFNTIKIVSKDVFNELLDNNTPIKDVIELDDKYLVKIFNKFQEHNETQSKREYNINIAIAAAVTGYARIYMSQFKNNPKLKLFYSDTDSIYTNLNPEQMNELYPGIVNNRELGKLKLENVSNKAIFLSPKSYYLKTIDGDFIYKIKGLIKKVPVTVNDFEQLLYKDSLIIKNQTKWYKSLSKGTIELLEQSYTLQQTDNKRKLIYNSNNKLIDTKPYVITKDDTIANYLHRLYLDRE